MNNTVECEKCFKYYNPVIFKGCSFCQSYSFKENFLCDLVRANSGDIRTVECCAYKANLSIVGEQKEAYDVVLDEPKKLDSSDRLKWMKAYALQRLRGDADKVLSNLNYHVCLVTKNRESLFERIQNELASAPSIFNNDIGSQFDGRVSLLHVSSDHIHIHIESTPDFSVDEILNKSVGALELLIMSEFPKLFREESEIFEVSCFVEGIG